MDQSAINEGNALIAEFLGWKAECGIPDLYSVPAPHAIQFHCEYTAYNPNEMKFHKDWNWLMELTNIIIYKNDCSDDGQSLQLKLIREISYVRKDCIYEAAVEFCKWHNERKKHNTL